VIVRLPRAIAVTRNPVNTVYTDEADRTHGQGYGVKRQAGCRFSLSSFDGLNSAVAAYIDFAIQHAPLGSLECESTSPELRPGGERSPRRILRP
jgi:hypothetical protein